jgi:ATP-binding cassette subfamily B protein RaxB
MLNLQGERLADIVLTAPEHEAPTLPVDAIDASLEVRGLSFRYSDTEPFVLLNCSFAVTPGECVAGGRPIRRRQDHAHQADARVARAHGRQDPRGRHRHPALGIDRYRKLVGTVMQDDQLFAGSIADNISFFDPSPDQQAIERIARMAAVHDDIVAMPMGYNTLIGDMGAALSAGRSSASSSRARSTSSRASSSSTRRRARSTCRRSAR